MSATRSLVLVALAAALGSAPLRAEAPTAPGGYVPVAASDELPSQERFRGWPPKELLRQPYWLPWSDLSFLRAALFGRPVLFVLTVGWSKTADDMLHGTLSDPDVLATINQGYVAVLVDADRRPDIRERYLTGAWPVVAFLLPNGQPMLSQVNDRNVARPITTSSVGSNDMRFLLVEGLKYWAKWPALLEEVAAEWTRREAADGAVQGVVDELASDQVARWLGANRDAERGGFGAAPKFLNPGFADYAALRAARLRPELAEHAARTLSELVASPLVDAEHGGLRRMAAAPGWGAVQTEKLLETNADFLRELSTALRVGSGDPAPLRRELERTAAFVTRDLARPEGGFYLAQAGFADPRDAQRPAVDTLVLAGPNARAGAALVRAGAIVGDESLVAAGRRALDLVYARAWSAGAGVRHVIEPDPTARLFLVALADTAFAFVDAYESLGERRYLDAAQDIAEFAGREFGGAEPGALVDHLPEAGALGLLANPRRPLIPNVRLARTMLRLAHHGRGAAWRAHARAILEHYAGDLAAYQVHGIEAGVAIEEFVREPLRIRIEGPAGGRAGDLRRAALASPWPWTLIDTGSEVLEPAAIVAWGGKSERVTDPAALRAVLLRLTGPETP